MSYEKYNFATKVIQGTYDFDMDSILGDPALKTKLNVRMYNDYHTSGSDIIIDNWRCQGTGELIEYLIRPNKPNKYFEYTPTQILNRAVKNVYEDFIRLMMDKQLMDVTFDKHEVYKKNKNKLKSDIRNIIKSFVDDKKEYAMREVFFNRIRMTNTDKRIHELHEITKTFGYFVVPKDGLFTLDVRNLMMVKSDPRNGYRNIVDRAVTMYLNHHEDFACIEKDPNIQINSELKEQLIPFV